MKKLLVALIATFSLFACSKKDEAPIPAAPMAAKADVSSEQTRKSYLAYTHTLSVKTTLEGVNATHSRIIEGCKAAREACMLLDSRLSQGQYASAHIQLRLKPEAIKQVMALATTGNQITEQNTSAEDLAHPVQDNAKRLELLASYQKRLLALEQKSTGDLDALIKLSKEIASVQTQLEQASGEKAQLFARIDMEVLNIDISASQHSSFWRPILEAFSGFLDHLSSSISTLITVSAYLLPWMLVFALVVMGIRKIWRRKKNSGEQKKT